MQATAMMKAALDSSTHAIRKIIGRTPAGFDKNDWTDWHFVVDNVKWRYERTVQFQPTYDSILLNLGNQGEMRQVVVFQVTIQAEHFVNMDGLAQLCQIYRLSPELISFAFVRPLFGGRLGQRVTKPNVRGSVDNFVRYVSNMRYMTRNCIYVRLLILKLYLIGGSDGLSVYVRGCRKKRWTVFVL
jgi:hypothetical protein